MRRPLGSMVVGVAAALLTVAAGAGAAPAPPAPRGGPVGAELRVSGAGAVEDEDSPSVAANGAGEYLVVWRDHRSVDSRGLEIYGRRVSTTGAMLGGAFRISGPGAVSHEQFPAVAWNGGAGEYLVVWQDLRDAATAVYGRRVSAAGAAVEPDFPISSPNATMSTFSGPAVACHDSSDECLVVWQDQRNSDTRGADVYGRRVSSGGAVLGTDFRITGLVANSDEWNPAVAWNGTAGKYLVVWEDERHASTTGRLEVYGRRVAASGAMVGGDFLIARPGGAFAHMPAVAPNGAGNEFLVVWRDGRNEATRGNDIYGRRVSAAGWPVGGAFCISGAGALDDESFPVVAWNGTVGQYGVVWGDRREAASRNADIYGRLVSSAGVAAGSDVRISGVNAIGEEGNPATAWNSTANQFLVVWHDLRDTTNRGLDIFGRRLAG